MLEICESSFDKYASHVVSWFSVEINRYLWSDALLTAFKSDSLSFIQGTVRFMYRWTSFIFSWCYLIILKPFGSCDLTVIKYSKMYLKWQQLKHIQVYEYHKIATMKMHRKQIQINIYSCIMAYRIFKCVPIHIAPPVEMKRMKQNREEYCERK